MSLRPAGFSAACFAHLIITGTMTDRRAAETAGLNPESAAYTDPSPGCAYMAGQSSIQL
jgi:hypothetical protein